MKIEARSVATTLGRALWRRFLLGLALGVGVLAAVAVVADLRAVVPVLTRFAWELLPVVLLLTVGNYACRFLKWELYLRWVGVRNFRRTWSLAVFLAGFAMSITPGKVGEWLKAYLVVRLGGRSSAVPLVPVVAAERLTDGIAMLILGLVSAFIGAGWGWQPLALLAAIVLLGLWLVQEERITRPLLRLAARTPGIRTRAGALEHMYDAARAIISWRRLLLVSSLSVFSWSLECVGLFLILIGLDLRPTLELLAVATFVLSTASIAGALSLLPGGLGAAEAGIAGLLVVLEPEVTTPVAATATVLIRISTLWFGVFLGAVALLWLQHRVLRADRREPGRVGTAP
ncbi:MAG: flippase-like domain-containing protein [Thermomicrobium sp.]|nr:flippase-like domain-containing protein [Thermomicrobium sp.]MDW7982283.1 lysylphosphatidylglycerol synthase transmembrane domain-containing protein [Thermomicrobium sp.]